MIATTALLATVLPNVGPTEVLLKSRPLLTIPNFCLQLAADPRDAGRLEQLGGDLEAVGAERLVAADLLDDRVLDTGGGDDVPDLRHARALDETGRDPRAGREVDPEVETPAADRERADEQDHAGHREEVPRGAHEVEPDRPPLATGAERRRAVNRPRVAHRHQDRLRRQHGGEQRDDRADTEREREALDVRGREHEQDERGHDRDDVRVDDRGQALLVAGDDALPDRASGADLLLDAFEDDDVRVSRDADREDQAGDARQRQRDRDELDQRVEVDPVDDQADGRDHAEHAVERDQEHDDDQQADETGDQALVERLLAERRRHLGLGDQLEVDRQRAEPQLGREVLRGLDREAAGDVGAAAALDPVRVGLEVDLRDRDQLVVERDREVLVELLTEPAHPVAAMRDVRGDVLERLLPLGREREGDVRAAGLVGRLLRVRDVVAEQRHVVLEHVERRRWDR